MPHPQLNGELYTTSLVDLLLQAAYPKSILTQRVLLLQVILKNFNKNFIVPIEATRGEVNIRDRIPH
jgi:hypothetical protein